MFNNKITMLVMFILLTVVVSCYKVTTLVIEDKQEITTPVSLANDIQPILDKNCNTVGCHNTGGKAPDLTSANAYNSMTNGGYLNVNLPESSEMYFWLTGVKKPIMPIGENNPSNINNLMLAWIKQGAKNN